MDPNFLLRVFVIEKKRRGKNSWTNFRWFLFQSRKRKKGASKQVSFPSSNEYFFFTFAASMVGKEIAYWAKSKKQVSFCVCGYGWLTCMVPGDSGSEGLVGTETTFFQSHIFPLFSCEILSDGRPNFARITTTLQLFDVVTTNNNYTTFECLRISFVQ